MTICVDLDVVEAQVPATGRCPQEAVTAAALTEWPQAGGLPVRSLLGLAGSGVFAFWTSLTCFVC